MRYLLSSLLIILIYCAGLSGQTKNVFIKDFIRQYEERKRQTLTDKGHVYVPCIINLYDKSVNGHDLDWWDLLPTQRRDSIYSYLINPVLTNDFALDTLSYNLYSFPYGRIYYHNQELANIIVGPLRFENWHYFKVVVPLIQYIRTNNVHYIFSIENLFNDVFLGHYWTIEGDQLYVLSYDTTESCYYKRDADDFIYDPNNLFLFNNPILDITCNE